MTILILAVGSVSIMATSHLAMADQNGKQCVFFSCGNVNITGGTSSSSGGSGGGGQPTPSTATLIVTKKCAPADRPCRPQGFEITVSGNNPSPSTVHDDGTGTPVTLGPGSYTVSETPPTGFSVSFSGDCAPNGSGNINAGETKKCTVTNTLQTGTLKVVKKVSCITGTNCAAPSDFELTVSGNSPNPSTFNGEAAPGTTVTAGVGDFQITETKQPPTPSFSASFSGDCNASGQGTIVAGQTKTCTVTNTEKQSTATGTLTVIKEVRGCTQGTAGCPSPSDFTLKITKPDGKIESFEGRSAGTSFTVTPGTYVVSDENPPNTFSVSFSGDCQPSGSGNINAGETQKCTITNKLF